MKLSTGKIAFPITIDDNSTEYIYVNPQDPNLMFRLKALQGNLLEKIKQFDDVELTPEGKPATDSFVETFEKIQNIFFEEIDNAFGSKVSKVAFKYCSPFAIVEGLDVKFCEVFIREFISEIENEIRKRNSNKYAKKYNKKK